MHRRHRGTQARLLCGAAALALTIAAGQARAEDAGRRVTFDIPAQSLAEGLNEFARQSGYSVMFTPQVAAAKRAPALGGALDTDAALDLMLQGSGLAWRRSGDTYLIVQQGGSGPQSQGAGGDVEALIVTAQKREENIQDVPIAISAFTAEALEQQKIEGGFDLLKAIPNVTFSKNNFTSYNFSIRGIGTKAVSATTDPGVAVSFNNSGLIVNRLFEQEYFDVERVEVLRGPQGTLYGRNATAGVINVISAKPDLDEFKGWVKGEVGNYNTKRVSAMVNVPLADDKLAVRLAGALTSRDGYGYNAVTQSPIDGRDLWSARLTVGFNPTDSLRTNLIWERFEEDDDRARTSKQLCHTDPGPESILDIENIQPLARAIFSQGCLPGSLYDAGAFRAPNGDSLPYIIALKGFGSLIIDPFVDPYGGLAQSSDLREISSAFDPIYRAKADVFELNAEYDLTPELMLVSQTLYNRDSIFSRQDYNRFNTKPVFTTSPTGCQLGWMGPYSCPGGYFTDPQLGASNSIVIQDISQGKSRQFSQEFRLQSDFDGPLNFSVGANYVRFNVDIDYYVIGNVLTLAGLNLAAGTDAASSTDPNDPDKGLYIDPNPLESITGYGQNYFRSVNPYKLASKSVFGELYWRVSEALKVTAGLRYTDDRKKFELWPTALLNSNAFPLDHEGDISQHWGEFTGRIGFDWTPELAFTDHTMVYAFYSRGYKAGGANPPNMAPPSYIGSEWPIAPNSIHPTTFDPEFVDAFEVGSKNVLLGGGLILNATAFFYDYKNYQISQIIDRLALNENYDATSWGLELETLWSPTANLRINANLGYLDTSIGDGQASIDVMNRTYGHEDDWVLLKNWLQYPSNCVVPKEFAAAAIQFSRDNPGAFSSGAYLDRGPFTALFDSPCAGLFSPTHEHPIYQNFYYLGTGIGYDPFDSELYPDSNSGSGFVTPVGGNELPNAPHWTANVGAQYSFDILAGWRTTVRGDAYWQSQSWARVYNAVNDKLHGWYNANLSVWFENDDGLKIELYVKNLLDADPITDAFLNSDDSGLTTNVFVLDPRLIGLSIRKEF